MEEPCTIDCLPDALLGHIIVLVGRRHGRNVTLVSRRWQRLFYSEPALWRDFEVLACGCEAEDETEQRLEGKAALLRRVAPLVQCFSWDQNIDEGEATAAGLARCLKALQPGALAELRLSGGVSLQGGAGAALQRLTSIRSLQLEFCTERGTLTSVAAVGSYLRSLHLRTHDLSPAAVDSIAQLTQLTALGIQARDWPELGALTRLSQLKQLVLLNRGREGTRPMQPPFPASFASGLERFSFESDQHSFQIGGCQLRSCALWHGRTDPLRIQTWLVPEGVPLPTLALHCSAPVPSLAQLFSSLQPAGEPPRAFVRLELEGSLPQPRGSAGCPQLSQLRELALANVQPADGSALEAGLAGLLQQARQLASLDIRNTGWRRPGQNAALGAVPACLASYRGLTSLTLDGQELVDLPPGEYLTGLRHLDLQGNSFSCVPAAISAATGLTSLALSWNQNLSLCEAGTETLLTLRHLQHLQLMMIKAVDSTLLRRLPPSISYNCSVFGGYR